MGSRQQCTITSPYQLPSPISAEGSTATPFGSSHPYCRPARSENHAEAVTLVRPVCWNYNDYIKGTYWRKNLRFTGYQP